jgi:hypothetical protein
MKQPWLDGRRRRSEDESVTGPARQAGMLSPSSEGAMRVGFLFLVAASMSLPACVSHRDATPPVAEAATRARVVVDATLFRLTPEAAKRLMGSDLGDEERTLVFDAARSKAFFKSAKSPSSGVDLVDWTIFLALEGRRSVAGGEIAYHLDAEGLIETEGEVVLVFPTTRSFEVAIRADVQGDHLTLDLASVWSDARWVGKSPRPCSVDLSAKSTVPLSGSTVLVVSRVLQIGQAWRERYVLAVSPQVLRATEVAAAKVGAGS